MDFVLAKEVAIKYIGISKKTEYEVRNKLKGKNVSPLVIDAVIEYIEELGYINDDEYVKAFLRTNYKASKYFVYEIKQKLLQKGIKTSIIEENIETFLMENNDYDDMVKEKLFAGKLKNYEEEKKTAYIYRRGYRK